MMVVDARDPLLPMLLRPVQNLLTVFSFYVLTKFYFINVYILCNIECIYLYIVYNTSGSQSI